MTANALAAIRTLHLPNMSHKCFDYANLFSVAYDNDERVRIWKKAGEAHFKVLPWFLPGKADENCVRY
jgi:hypothetical protein